MVWKNDEIASLNENISTIVSSFPKPTRSFVIDWNKVTTVEDCILLIKSIVCGNYGNVSINNTCQDYEKLRHLAVDGSEVEI